MEIFDQLMSSAQTVIALSNSTGIKKTEIIQTESVISEFEQGIKQLKSSRESQKQELKDIESSFESSKIDFSKIYSIAQDELAMIQKDIESKIWSWSIEEILPLIDKENLMIRKLNLSEERTGLDLTVKPERKVGKVSIQ